MEHNPFLLRLEREQDLGSEQTMHLRDGIAKDVGGMHHYHDG